MRIAVKSEVEVWTPDPAKPPNGAWRAGVVTWGNGHSYIMRWLDGGPESGRIRRQFVRPCPPPVPLPVDLNAGDTVEVFDNNLWKLAEVVGGGAGNRQYDVKITGSSKVLTADRRELRVQQRLSEDDAWLVVNKDNHDQGSAVPSRPVAGKHVKSKAIGNGIGKLTRPPAVFKPGAAKRSHPMVESDIVRDVKRFQGNNNSKPGPAVRYDGNIEVMDVHPSFYMEKQQQQKIVSTNEVCDVVGIGTNSSSDGDASGQSAALSVRDSSSDSDSSSSGSDSDSSSSSGSDDSSSDSDSSSSGSNSSNSGGDRGVSPREDRNTAIQQLPPVSCKKEQQQGPSDDRTESRASAGTHHRFSEEKAPLVVEKQQQDHHQEEEEEDGRIHGLELEAYVNVMKAFHASGSLDWEKEELLSNLRAHLHISGDEHLQVIWLLNGKRPKPSGPRAPHNGRC